MPAESNTGPAVIWFRRDLRIYDHPALVAAAAHERLAPLFVLDDALLGGRAAAPNRVAFMLEALASLDASLRALGTRLHTRRGRPTDVVPGFAAECGASDIYISRDYTPYGRTRDGAVRRALAGHSATLHARPGLLIHEPEDVLTREGAPYGVFTPYRRTWDALPRRNVLPAPSSLPPPPAAATGGIPTAADLGIAPTTASLPLGSETAARSRLDAWCAAPVDAYREQRNILAADGTSRLSPYLRWGLLSPAEVAARCASAGDGAALFTSELAWRDFYFAILWHHPRVVREPYQRQFARLRFAATRDEIAAWRAGRTGYPVVDAAMRQLLATGWMHNRARMIVSSFFTKDLLADWRIGEAHFMAHLVDGDVPANNGGWQWSASTGTDAQPYFRVFNPSKQAQNFDGDGAYVRRWVPELANVPPLYIHEPWTMPPDVQHASACRIGVDYPAPIVDHAAARQRALSAYEAARSGT